MSGRRPMYRRAFQLGLVLLLVVVIVYVVVPEVSQARSDIDVLSSVAPGYLGLGLTLEVASLLSYSAMTRAVLPPVGRPSYATILRADVTGLGVSHVVPGGGATSTALRFRLLTAAGVPPAQLLSATTIESAGMAAVLALVLVSGAALALTTVRGDPYLLGAGALALLLLLLGALLVVALLRREEAVVRAARALAERVSVVRPDASEAFVRTLSSRLALLGTERRVLGVALAWATANWVFDAASLWVFLQAFGDTISLPGMLLGYGLASVLALLPLTPGGLGVVEGALVSVLAGFGAGHAHALLGVLSWRLAEFWLPIPAAALAYVSLRTGVLRHRGPTRGAHTGPTSGPSAPKPRDVCP